MYVQLVDEFQKRFRSVDNVLYPTYAEAAYQRGLFSDHDEFQQCMMELIQPLSSWQLLPVGGRHPMSIRAPHVLRRTFVAMCFCGGSAPILFDLFWFYMALDLPRGREHIGRMNIPEAERKDYLLRELQDLLFLISMMLVAK